MIFPLLVLLCCTKPDNQLQESSESDNVPPPATTAKATTLGAKLKGQPFSVQTARQAFANLLNRKGMAARSDASNSTLQPTHQYYKITPQSETDVIRLDTLGYDVWDTPLDQEITNNGETYHDPSLPEDQITYLYTVVPVGTPLPSGIQAELLQELYLYDDDAGDEADPEDPWDPGYPRCYQNVNGQIYEVECPGECDPNIIMECNACMAAGKRVNRTNEATRFLKSKGINPVEFYNEAMRITGNEQEIKPVGTAVPNSGAGARRYNPRGRLWVEDNDAGRDIELKRVLVKARRFFKLDEDYTDGTGSFFIDKGYRKKATVVVKFKNEFATVRGINGLPKVWQYVFPVKRNLGQFTQSEMENISFTFRPTSQASDYQTVQWVAATYINNTWDMREYCDNNIIPQPPRNMNVWVSSAVTTTASAPMLRYIHNTIITDGVIDLFLDGTIHSYNPLIRRILQQVLPDITCRYGAGHGLPQTPFNLNNTFFHEQAHAVHYRQAGNAYWIAEIAYTVLHRGYGDKGDNGAGRVAVVEGWGYVLGNTFNDVKYRPFNPTLADDERRELEEQIPGDNIWEQWVPFGMFHDMRDNGEPFFTGVADHVNTYTIQQLYRGLQPSADNVQQFRNEVLSRNNNLQAPQVNQLVTSYRY